MINRNWKVTRTDPQLVRFGLLWKVVDLVALKGVDFRLPILESKPSPILGGCYLLGGVAGNSFFVAARGCEQPRAGRGIIRPGLDLPFGSNEPLQTIK